MREKIFGDNKNFKGDKLELFKRIALDYDFGDLKKYSKVEIGYEDDNNVIETTKGTYFVKIFGSYRDLEECKRYTEILEKVAVAGIRAPKLYAINGKALYSIEDNNLSVFEFIDGKTFYELGKKPTEDEAKKILHEAAKINQIDLKPSFVYDDWAIINILDQYKIVENYLSSSEKAKISPLVDKFKESKIEALPHCLVHGDIITTNVIIDAFGKIYIIDFACANYCPRIVELAVLACNLLAEYELEFILKEYEKHNALIDRERELFPLFVDLAHAMHIIGAVRERDIYGNKSSENEYWLQQGVVGLKLKK